MIQDHKHIENLLGVYSLDALDDEERRSVDRHLEACPRCRSEVQEHREVAASLLGESSPSPTHVWDGIASELDASDSALAPVIALPGQQQTSDPECRGPRPL